MTFSPDCQDCQALAAELARVKAELEALKRRVATIDGIRAHFNKEGA